MPGELLVDYSRYDIDVNYNLLRNGDVRGIIAKAGGSNLNDPLAMKHSSSARSLGVHFGVYYWIDPLHDGDTQARHAVALAKALGAEFICGDVEQWWANWSLWQAWRLGKAPLESVPVLPLRQIETVTRKWFERVERETSPNWNERLLFYSSDGFMSKWGASMKPWVGKYKTWLAQWPYTGTPPTLKKEKLTWEVLKRSYMPTRVPTPLYWMNKPTMWQWTGDRFTLEGNKKPIDINMFMGESSLSEWLGSEPPAPSPKPYKEMMLTPTTYGLNVRETPVATAKILRVIVPGEIVCVTEETSGSWVKLYGERGWAHGGYLKFI
jgi:GH25 family lysozyme M1 (1,4-beta-N-acetylmuramidase)